MTRERRLVPHLPRVTTAPFHARVPGSKSETVRALFLAAGRAGTTTIAGAARGDDAEAMARAVSSFAGVAVTTTADGLHVERARGPLRAPSAPIDVGHGATPARLLLAFAAMAEGATTITGSAQLRARPMQDGVDALRALGIRCDWLGAEGHLPVRVHGGLPRGDRFCVRADTSSQFASALVLLASCLRDRTRIVVALDGEIASRPYLDTTIDVQRRFGIAARWNGEREIEVVPADLVVDRVRIEPDASSAGYLLAVAALTRGTVVVDGLDASSVQADLGLVRVLRAMGCEVEDRSGSLRAMGRELRGVDADFASMPDAALTIAALAAAATGASTLTGLRTLRQKESDRIASASEALRALGAGVESGPDWLRIVPQPRLRPAAIDPHDDHRVAMAFALLGLAQEGIEVLDPRCVQKSFPDFFAELDRFAAWHRGG